MKHARSRSVAVAVLASALCLLTLAAPPAWWTERNVLTPGGAPDDYAVANQGQLKHIASQAASEMNEKLSPGGAGTAINTLVGNWRNSRPDAPPSDDYAGLNQGQLKHVAKLFYDRLFDVGYTGAPLQPGRKYPWTDSTSDDDSYALVNIGQLKFVFSFTVPTSGPGAPGDTDGDGLPDAWELNYWSNLQYGPNDDPDGDGVTNFTEYLLGRNPTKAAIVASGDQVNMVIWRP